MGIGHPPKERREAAKDEERGVSAGGEKHVLPVSRWPGLTFSYPGLEVGQKGKMPLGHMSPARVPGEGPQHPTPQA